MANMVLSIIFIVFAGVFLFFSLQLPPSESSDLIGPGAWPTFILSLMLFLSIVLLVRSIMEWKGKAVKKPEVTELTELQKEENEVKEKIENPPSFSYKHWMVAMMLLLYLLLMPWTGFTITTIILVLPLAWLLGMERKINILVTALASSLVFSYVFITLLRLPLPRGIAIFEDISLFFQ